MRDPTDLTYCMDSSAFIDMERAAKHVPGLWEAVGDLADRGRLIMHKEVQGECMNEENEAWFDAHHGIVKSFSPELGEAMAQLQADLTTDGQFMVDPSSNRDKADPWVVALAMAENMRQRDLFGPAEVVVVAHEKATGTKKGKVRIPDACVRYGIRCISLRDLLENEGLRLGRA